MPHTVYFSDGSGKVQTADDGSAYYYTTVNGQMVLAGRFIPGRPDISTIPDPNGPGGVVTTRKSQTANSGAGGGTSSANQGGLGGAGATAAPAGSSMDDYLDWLYQIGVLNSAEQRRLLELSRRDAQAAKQEADDLYAADKAESDARYAESEARQKKYDRENAARQQVYNVESARNQGISDIQASMPGYAPASVESALMKWAQRLGVGFNAEMPVTPDVNKFYSYLTGKGFSPSLVPKTGGTNGQ